MGIYRDEVIDIFGGLADISSDTLQILAICEERTRRMRMKRMTPDEWKAYVAAREAEIAKLRERAERIRLELEAKRREKPA